MRSALLEFERSTSDLSSLLERYRLEEQLLALPEGGAIPADLGDLLAKYRKSVEPFSLKHAQYSTQLVLLYGAFERFIEGLLVGAADALSGLVPSFAQLPKRVRENHRRKSLDALRDEIWLSRQDDEPKLVSRLIENLHGCESGAGNFALNSVAYARHGANFRRGQIDDAFRELAVDDLCKRVALGEHFRAYLEDCAPPGLLDSSLNAIDDLAERRNEISHGSPSQLLNLDELGAYLSFFRAFARGAYIALRRHLGQFVVGYHAVSLGRISKVHYKHVVLIDTGVLQAGTKVEVGDLLAIRLQGSSGFELGTIRKLRIDAGDVRVLRAHAGLEVGIEADIRLRESQDLHLLNGDNSTVRALGLALPDAE